MIGKDYTCNGQMSIFDFLDPINEEPAAGFMNEPVHTCHDCYWLRSAEDIPLKKRLNGPVCRQIEVMCENGDCWQPKQEPWEEYLAQNILRGTAIEGGKKRIVDIYDSSMNQQERIAALKKEYGSGGWAGHRSTSYLWGGSVDGSGMKVIVKGPDKRWQEKKFSWKKVDEMTMELIWNGRYREYEE